MAKILLVDDDRAILTIVTRILQADGHTVYPLEDGSMVSRYMTEMRPDLIILDVLMPDMNGVEVLDAIRAQDPLIPVIVCSGAIELEPFVEYSNISCFLSKPLDFDLLRKRVQQFASP